MAFHKSVIEFGVIGLGRFGFALAKELGKAGKDVLVLDMDESKVKQIRVYTDNAFVVSQLDKETLEGVGIQNCQTVFVCIGEKIDVSILTTLNVISMGVPRVISRAMSDEQGYVLEKIGAEVVYPERDMAHRIANSFMSNKAVEFIKLYDDINISELKLTPKLAGISVQQANLRERFNLNIIALEHNQNTSIDIKADTMLTENDLIVVLGKTSDIAKFEDFLIS